MLTNVVVVAPPGASWSDFTLPMLAPGANGLFITKIEGLTPVASNVVTKDYGIGDGEYFVGSHRGKRNIVLSLEMESRGVSVEAAREALYGYLFRNQGGSLKFRFEFDNKDPVQIEGYLESNESDRFVQDPETQISIICPKPNFIDPVQQTATGLSNVDPAMTTLLYSGNRSAGFLIRIVPNVASGTIELGRTIYQTAVESSVPGVYLTSTAMELYASGYDEPMAPEEEFWLDSRQGRKSVYILNTTTGARRNAMKGMTNASRWPILHPGNNLFRISTPDSSITREWTVYYSDEFGGV